MERKPLYEIGDEVKIIKYGAIVWLFKNIPQPKLSLPIVAEDETMVWLDMIPDIVGKTGLVSHVKTTQGVPRYIIDGIKGKSAWYDESQMELVNKNSVK